MVRQKLKSFFYLSLQGLIVLILIFFLTTNKIYSVECQSDSDLKNKTEEELKQTIEACEQKLDLSRKKINTLSSEIQFMDTRIYLTTIKIKNTEQSIKKTEEEINVLSSRIEGLDSSLDYLSNLLLEGVIESYKRRPLSMMMMLLDSDTASEFLTQFKYLRTTQKNNQKLLIQVQETKVNFEEQKKIREEKKKELDTLKITLDEQKKALDNQKLAKNRLLKVTKNNERSYQQLLAKARVEYNAIRAIVAGSGTEAKLREVKSGDVIASLISGPSCNSSGAHLHFIVKENDQVSNPFNYFIID